MEQTLQSEKGLRKFIGDKQFYRTIAMIVVPMIIQNTVSNVVNLLDNVMVGQVGTLQMSAVAIINQLLFVFNLCIFGGMAGPGIFSTQYVGAGDSNGIRNCFRLKLWLAFLMTAIALIVFLAFPEPLIRIYLTESGTDGVSVMQYAKEYLTIMVAGLLPFALTTGYAMTLRENGETRIPMIASLSAICVNLLFNWLLIFGNLGFPVLGVRGAAIATVLSRFVELGIVSGYAHRHPKRFPYFHGAYRTLSVPGELVKRVVKKGFPLLLNEFLWSAGLAAVLACYSTRGIEAVAACNIASTVNNLFNTVFISMGNAVSIMLGRALGAGETQKAKGLAWKLMATSMLASAVMGGIMLLISPLIPRIYNTEESVKQTAILLLRVLAVMMPAFSITNCCYFTLRAGGRTIITFFFDCVFTWAANYMLARFLCGSTTLPVPTVYAIEHGSEIIKIFIGIVLVAKGIWIRNIVSEDNPLPQETDPESI